MSARLPSSRPLTHVGHGRIPTLCSKNACRFGVLCSGWWESCHLGKKPARSQGKNLHDLNIKIFWHIVNGSNWPTSKTRSSLILCGSINETQNLINWTNWNLHIIAHIQWISWVRNIISGNCIQLTQLAKLKYVMLPLHFFSVNFLQNYYNWPNYCAK